MRTVMSFEKLREAIHSIKGRSMKLLWVDDNDNLNTIELGRSVNMYGKNLALGLLPSDKWITLELDGFVAGVSEAIYKFGL